MREFLFVVVFAGAWLAGGLLLDDYITLHNRVSAIEFRAGEQNARKAESEHRADEQPKWTDVALAVLTAALAVFTLGLYLDARAKGRKELRAYLGIKDKGIRRLAANRYQAFIDVENSGKTPAHDVRVALHYGIGIENGPATGFPTGAPVGPMPLAPGGQRPVRQVLWNLRNEDILRVAAPGGEGDIFVWGRIEYRDIYDDFQHLNFRFVTREVESQVVPVFGGRATVEQITGWPLQPTEDGNDAS